MGRPSAYLVPRLRPVDEVLSAIYRVDLPTDAWLKNVGALQPIDESQGYAMYIVRRCSTGEGTSWTTAAVDGDETGRTLFAHCAEVMGTDGAELVPRASLCGSQSETMGAFPLPQPWRGLYEKTGTRDIWALFGLCAEGHLIGLSHLLPRRAKTTRRLRRFWSAVSIHLSAAYRLHSVVHRRSEAVLAPDGTLLHAEGLARDEANRDALRCAARAIDRAKMKTAEPLAAIESWTAMVSGRWTLVDEFESDGRRFMVARVNEPEIEAHSDLSERERHVATLAALGRSNKEIAYELGLAPSSVASYVGRLRKKLGVRRSELIR